MAEVIEAGESAVKRLTKALWPRKGGSDYSWRRNISMVVIALVLAVPCWAFIAYGGAEPHLPGFVTTDSYTDLARKVDFLTQDRMEQVIQDKFWQWCTADDGYRRDLQEQLNRLQSRYQSMFGHPYPTGSCK